MVNALLEDLYKSYKWTGLKYLVCAIIVIFFKLKIKASFGMVNIK